MFEKLRNIWFTFILKSKDISPLRLLLCECGAAPALMGDAAV
jgi:hypothetical protein